MDSDALRLAEEFGKDLIASIRAKRNFEISVVITKLQNLPDRLWKCLFPLGGDGPCCDENAVPLEIVKEILPAACKEGHLDIVLVLLHHGADPKLKGEEGSPLEVASLYGHIVIVQKLLEFERDLCNDQQIIKECMAKACLGGHSDVVKYWIEKLKAGRVGGNDSQHEFSVDCDPVTAAQKGGYNDIVKILLYEFWTKEGTAKFNANHVRLVANWKNKQLANCHTSWLHPTQSSSVLVNIDLSENLLHDLPGKLFWGLPYLEKINVSRNRLSKIPAPTSMNQLEKSRLKCVNLSVNQLTAAPAELFMLPRLEDLFLQHNKIGSIGLSNFQLKLKTKGSWQCQSLKILDLSNNQLEAIPVEIEAAKNLVRLNVSDNRMSAFLKPWHCPLVNLKALGNNMAEFPDIHAYWSKTLSTLDLSRNNLTEVPSTLCRITALMDLRLSENHITALPDPKTWRTPQLRSLDLSHNLLLHEVQRSPTRQTSGFMSTLRKLSGNKDHEALKQPSSTFYVDIDNQGSNNRTLTFPELFNSQLNSLNLSYNRLQGFPMAICDMTSLQTLDLCGNDFLNELPEKLALLSGLYSIKLDPHQIKKPAGIERIMTETEGPLHTIAPKILLVLKEKYYNYQPYRGVKLMIVGPQHSGKTSLMTSISGCTWPEDDNENGVNVKAWKLTKALASESSNTLMDTQWKKQGKDTAIVFAIWDLKGESDYSVIHQMFLTPYTLFLLVWDGTHNVVENQRMLSQWLQNIELSAPKSKAILVRTHMDMKTRDENIFGNLKARFSRILDTFCSVDARETKGQGIKELKEKIYNVASEMTYSQPGPRLPTNLRKVPLVGKKVPQVYLTVRHILAVELKKCSESEPPKLPILTEEQLSHHLDSIPNNRVKSSQEIQDAVTFLCESGSMVHVDDHTYRLTNLYFLDPAWLCRTLMDVVRYKDSDAHIQTIPKENLKVLCERSGFGQDRFEEYLQLLGRFEIALSAADNRHEQKIPLKSLVPDLFLVDLDLEHIDEGKIDYHKKLGEGGFGEVYKAEYCGKMVAVKKLLKGIQKRSRIDSLGDDEELIDRVMEHFPKFRSELAMMSQLRHTYILKLEGVSVRKLCFAMELAPMGDLASYVYEQFVCIRPAISTEPIYGGSVLPRTLVHKIGLQTLSALAYLHKVRVIHTDLKTDNILLFSADPDQIVNVKLADYGISRTIDAGGVKGVSGFHAFRAPELVKGQSFDEKVDIFSFGMLLYHIISGIVPFQDDDCSLVTKINITTGERPKFNHDEYTIQPKFPHLESMMRKCWQDDPISRPQAREAQQAMSEARFLCLKDIFTYDQSITSGIVYSSFKQSANFQTDVPDRAGSIVWLWRGFNKRRTVASLNVNHSTSLDQGKSYPGSRVKTAIQVGDLHILGTMTTKIHTDVDWEYYSSSHQEDQPESTECHPHPGRATSSIQVYKEIDGNLCYVDDILIPNEVVVTTLYYYPFRSVQSSDPGKRGYLFAGLEDGHLVVYEHESQDSGKDKWKQRKVLLLSVKPKTVRCMELTDDDELWIGCGNTLRVLSVKQLLLDPAIVNLPGNGDQCVGGLACYKNHMWCLVEESSTLYQFQISGRNLAGTFCCDQEEMSRGMILVDAPRSYNATGSFRHSADESITEGRLHVPHVRKRFNTDTTATATESSTCDATARCILAVKDTLWIGRDVGDILVIAIDGSGTCLTGEVLAVLSVNQMVDILRCPVKQLLHVESDHVVALRELDKTTIVPGISFEHQFLVWESWGSEDINKFNDRCFLSNR